jgi:hypothetical protein
VDELKRCWTGEQACARVLHRRRPFWRSPEMALAADLRRTTRKTSRHDEHPMHCPGQQRNLRPRAISLFGLSSPCRPAWPTVCLWTSPSRAALHLRGAYSSARTPYHQSNPFESQTRTWMRGGHVETPHEGWSWPLDN